MKSYSKQALVDVARDQWEVAASYLEYTENRYLHAIRVLQDAMNNDPDVIRARQDEQEARDLLDSANIIAKENQEK